MPDNIPNRPTAELAHIRIGIAPIVGNEYTPTSDFNTLPLFGPGRDFDVDDPWVKVRLTAGGDTGEMEKHGRRDIWTVRCTALLDTAAVMGDFRYGTLNGAYVEFILLLATGLPYCKGMGKLVGRLELPAQAGDPVLRHIEITRFLPTSTGNIVYANLATGSFA